MASSRDDFIIAIRSAFLKKSTQQKFSLLSLVFASILVILLSSLDFKAIKYLKIAINELVYRSSFVVSIPENLIKDSFLEINRYTSFFNEYKKNEIELQVLKSKNISSEIIQFENKELKELINDYVSSSDKVLAKIIVDHDSPFLKSIIINKGSKDNIKIGTNIYDQSYLVGRVIEVNYKTARVLLLSDLNSNVPVTIAPQNIQAIITGDGDKHGQVKYIKNLLVDELTEESTVYTSGTGAIFKSGIPIGKLKVIKDQPLTKFNVEFYSDFSQLKYVFAEIITTVKPINISDENSDNKLNIDKNPSEAKIRILEEEIEIIEDTNQKFKDENKNLKTEINKLKDKILIFQEEVSLQNQKIEQFNIDKKELNFLRLNLEYGHKCRKSFFNSKGFTIGTLEYKNCVLNRGSKNNG